MSASPFILENGIRRHKDVVILRAGNGHGSTNTVIRRFSTIFLNRGDNITYADSSTDGALFTINRNGIYSILYTDTRNTSGYIFGISRNSNQLTTTIGSINGEHVLAFSNGASAAFSRQASYSGVLMRGDEIRPHTSSEPNSTSNSNFNTFIIRLEYYLE